MTPKKFLFVGGVVLVLLGLLGMFGILGPTAADSPFGDSWWFDGGENWAHLIIGLVALLALKVFPASSHRPLVMLVGVIALLIGIYSIFSQDFMGANLENPADTILHVLVGIWALLASKKKSDMGMNSPMSTPSTTV